MQEELQSVRATATQLGVSRALVAELVNLLGIETKPIPTNGKAKGLDRAAVELIRGKIKALRGKK